MLLLQKKFEALNSLSIVTSQQCLLIFNNVGGNFDIVDCIL